MINVQTLGKEHIFNPLAISYSHGKFQKAIVNPGNWVQYSISKNPHKTHIKTHSL